MGNIYLVRHGQDTDNALRVLNGHRDTHLSDLGRAQAAATAEHLADKQISFVYSSPLARARETAAEIIRHTGATLRFSQMLIERDFGLFTGKPVLSIADSGTSVFYYREEIFFLDGPGVETFETTYARAKKIFNLVRDKHADENIVLVSHGDTCLMLLLAAGYARNIYEALQLPYMKNAEVRRLR